MTTIILEEAGLFHAFKEIYPSFFFSPVSSFGRMRLCVSGIDKRKVANKR